MDFLPRRSSISREWNTTAGSKNVAPSNPAIPDVRPWEELSAEGKKEKERHPLGRGDPEIVSSKAAGLAGSYEVVGSGAGSRPLD
jgi:hypothetical protein